MPLSDSDVRDWFTKQIHNFHYGRYLIYRGYTETGGVRDPDEDEEDVYPSDKELSVGAARVQPDELTDGVREAYEYYHKHYTEADIGSARVYQVPVRGETVYAVRTTTDGDDGYLEVFDAQGTLLGAARTNIDTIVWGARDWLREQVANYGEFTPEMLEARKHSFWGKPLPWDCPVECWQCQALGNTGQCTCRQGHRAEVGDLHRCNNGHTWDDTPPDQRIFVKPQFTLRLLDGREIVGTLTDYKMTFDTRLGSITVFAIDLKKIEFALANNYDDTNTIGVAIHRLGSDKADERAEAETELVALGFRAYPALASAASCGNEPIHQRARALAERIQASTPADLLNPRRTHRVTTVSAQFLATLPADMFSFTLINAEGYQSFDMTDVHSLTQKAGPTVDVPRPDPGWLGRAYANWFGAKLSFIVKGGVDYDLMGTGIYTMGSHLNKAAVHAGRVKPGETKVVRVEILLAPPRFVGSTQNGVESIDWDEPETGAFRFID